MIIKIGYYEKIKIIKKSNNKINIIKKHFIKK